MIEVDITLTPEQVEEVVREHDEYPQRFYLNSAETEMLLELLNSEAEKYEEECADLIEKNDGYNPYNYMREWFEGVRTEGPEVRFIISNTERNEE